MVLHFLCGENAAVGSAALSGKDEMKSLVTFTLKCSVEYVSCEPIPEVTYTPDISAEARKEYAERVMKRHKEKTEQG